MSLASAFVDSNRYKFLLGISPNLHDLAAFDPELTEQVSRQLTPMSYSLVLQHGDCDLVTKCLRLFLCAWCVRCPLYRQLRVVLETEDAEDLGIDFEDVGGDAEDVTNENRQRYIARQVFRCSIAIAMVWS